MINMRNMTYDEAKADRPPSIEIQHSMAENLRSAAKEIDRIADCHEDKHMRECRPDASCNSCSYAIINCHARNASEQYVSQGYTGPCCSCVLSHLSNWEPRP